MAIIGKLSFLFCPFAVESADPFMMPSSLGPAIGDPDAIASLIVSSLLNFAFADSKS